MKENQIVDIDGYTHVINGKVMLFKPTTYDLSKPEDLNEVLRISSAIFVSDFYPAEYGDDTLYSFRRNTLCPEEEIIVQCGVISVYLSHFSEEIQKKVRDAINEYRGTTGD